ncbi:hypothetical protein C2G38_2189938 [Gigaspora rosea]|uniref:Uncharacterized protein n=1 Tax=Gigaspora rosea TaxID=44941 RepID=A0A397V690_9GLOM|nr:hypothetical protein C2G38_2189938 [Gigaspora rosea]
MVARYSAAYSSPAACYMVSNAMLAPPQLTQVVPPPTPRVVTPVPPIIKSPIEQMVSLLKEVISTVTSNEDTYNWSYPSFVKSDQKEVKCPKATTASRSKLNGHVGENKNKRKKEMKIDDSSVIITSMNNILLFTTGDYHL